MKFSVNWHAGTNKFIFILLCCCLLFPACNQEQSAKKVDLSKKVTLPEIKNTHKSLKVAISGMVSPKETYIYYRNIVDYLADKMNMPPLIIQRGSYEAVNNLIRDKKIDLAFVCSGAYIKGKDEFGMELLVAPKINGQTVYYSYIVVHRDSNITEFSQLRGKTFAFTDPYSNSGYFAPRSLLAKLDETAESFFKKTVFTYNHDRSIKSVAMKFVDGAAVDSLIWEYMQATRPEYSSKTKIIQKVGPYGIPPVVVHPELNQETKERLRHIFLDMHKDKNGMSILRHLQIDYFVEIEDSAYDYVREMLLNRTSPASDRES